MLIIDCVMFFRKIDIEKILVQEKDKNESDLLAYTHEIIQNHEHTNQFTTVNKLFIDKLEIDKIYHISQIKNICIRYRLRFLDSQFYKLEIPIEATSKIRVLENEHQTSLHSFKILATAKALKLKNYDDPLLFIPIGNDYYYLIHKWGNDLNGLRRWMVMPFKNLENLTLFILLLSLLTTFILPNKTFNGISSLSVKLITFLFTFKMYCALFIYYFFWKGKQFSTFNWNSNYYN